MIAIINSAKIKKIMLGVCALTLFSIGIMQGVPRIVYARQTPCLILSTRKFPYKLYDKSSTVYKRNKALVLNKLKYATHFTTVPFKDRKKLKYREQMYCITFDKNLTVNALNGKAIVFNQIILPKSNHGHYILCVNTQEKEYYIIDSLSEDIITMQ